MGYMDVNEIRRMNLRRLANAIGGVSAVANRLDKSQGQISSLIGARATKNIGARIARQVEQVFGKPHGWLDHIHMHPEGKEDVVACGLSLDEMALITKYRRMSSGKRALFQSLADVLADTEE